MDLEQSLSVVAIVAAIRRFAPRIDGATVLVLAVLVGVLLAVALAYDAGQSLGRAVVSGALSGAAAVGGLTAIDRAKPAPAEAPDAPR